MRIKKLWLATIAALWCSITVSAYDFEVGGIYYNITSSTDLTVEVTSNNYSNDYSGAVVISSIVTYNGNTYRVTSIGSTAFSDCSSLSSITIPNSVTSIGEYAFVGCTSLASVEFKEGVETLGDHAFENCAALTEVVFPKSLTAIGANAFKGCSGITSVMVDKDVENFGEGAFEGCTAVKTLVVKGSVMPTVPSSALTTIVLYSPHPLATTEFANKVYRDATVYVSTGSKAGYQAADVWKNFWTIKEFDSAQEMGISLNETVMTLTEGESFTLTATITPEFMADMVVTWSTSDASVATINEDGTVTALAAGTATITATAGNMQATCVVTVKSKVIAVGGLTLNQTSATLIEGETLTLTATITPDNATDKIVTWSSSNTAIAIVDANGVVTAVAEGTAVITATAGDKTATCVVTVIKNDNENEEDKEDENEKEEDEEEDKDAGIEHATLNSQHSVIYDLQGRRVLNTENLKGIYIVNGKKVVIK